MKLMIIFEEYKGSLKMIEVEEIFDLIFYRPLAFLFVKLIYRTTLTPNQITIISMIFGILAGILYADGTYQSFIIAAIMIIIYNVLDCSDGQLARMKKSGTVIGRIIDGFADYIVSVAVYLGIGFGFAGSSDTPIFYWLLTVAAGLSNALHSLIVDYYRNNFMDYALNRSSTLGEDLEKYKTVYEELRNQKGKNIEKLLIWLYLQYSKIQTKSSSNASITKKYNPQEYYQKNKLMLHLWTYLGPTTEWTFLIICSLTNRLDIYLWGLVLVGNALVLVLYYLQKRITVTLSTVEVN
jgi:phosphatidylglycerophosphate synthase